jgi:ABC-type branched-subunit amino acid transport system ATPase component/ABC-type branched-subunit amino acid transport system permease subunit
MLVCARLKPDAFLSLRRLLAAHSRLVWFAVFLLWATFPILCSSQPYALYLLLITNLYILMALGMNLTVGWVNQVDLGYAAFFGIGAYVSAVLNVRLGVPFGLTLPLSILFAGLLASLVGVPLLRLRGHYFALATLGLGQITYSIAINWQSLTNGTDGIGNIERVQLFGRSLDQPTHLGLWTLPAEANFYWLSLAALVVAWFFVVRLYRSKFGRAWIAIGDDEDAAACFGIPVALYKLTAYVLAAAFGAVAGCLYAHTTGYINPSDLAFDKTLLLLCAVLLGGRGNPVGCAVGAVLLIIVPDKFQDLGDVRLPLVGLGLVVALWTRPQGLLPMLPSIRQIPESITPPSYTAPSRDFSRSLISVHRLCKSFNGTVALNGLDLEIKPGITVVVGPNGSGKSVFLNTITGVYKETAGSVLWLETEPPIELTHMPPHQVALLGISRSFQTPRLFSRLSVFEQVMIGRHRYLSYNLLHVLCGLRVVDRYEKKGEERVFRIMARFGSRLIRHANELPTVLSFANQRRLEVARALATNPIVLLLDEPTAGMNPQETDEMASELLQLPVKALVIVEHKLDFAERVADRVILLNAGKKILEGSFDTVVSSPEFKAAYLAENAEIQAPRTSYLPQSEPLLSLQEVEAGYGHQRVLHGITLEVRRGELVALLGGNASGKTTTLKSVLGLAHVFAGELKLDRVKLNKLPTYEIVRLGVAVVPEHYRLFSHMTVLENITLGAEATVDTAAIERVFTLFPELRPLASRKAGTLSGGQRQMVSIARALARSPKLVLVDEPSIGLAPTVASRVFQEIARLRESGASVLLVEQMTKVALNLADRVYILEKGRVVRRLDARDEVKSLRDDELLSYLTSSHERNLQQA